MRLSAWPQPGSARRRSISSETRSIGAPGRQLSADSTRSSFLMVFGSVPGFVPSCVLPANPSLFEAIVLLVEIGRDVLFLIRKVAGAKLCVAIAALRQQLRRSAPPPLAAKIDLIRI